MMGSFDTSSANGLGALGLGPTDEGQPGGAGGVDGRTALDTTSPFAIWGNGSFTSVDNDFANSAYDGDVWAYNIGMDYRFAETLTAGVSIGYSDSDLTTAFNNGSYREKGWTLSPYAIYRPVEDLTLVGALGYGTGDIDVTRSNNAVIGDTDSEMWFASLSAAYRMYPSDTMPLSLTPSVELVAAQKTVDAYRDSTSASIASTRSNTRQLKPALELAYAIRPSDSLTVTPFLESGLVHDFTDAINGDKTAFSFGGGLRLSDRETGLNAAMEGNYLAGRTDYGEYTLSGTVLYGFALSDDEGRPMGTVKPFLSADLNEYGDQLIRTGLGFDHGRLSSELAFSRTLSVADTELDQEYRAEASIVTIRMSMPF